jgi:hypothetical protein
MTSSARTDALAKIDSQIAEAEQKLAALKSEFTLAALAGDNTDAFEFDIDILHINLACLRSQRRHITLGVYT